MTARSLRRTVLVVLVLAAPFVWTVTTWEPHTVPATTRSAATGGTRLLRHPLSARPLLGILTGPTDTVITGLLPGSPAEAAGLRVGDVVRRVDDDAIDDSRQLQRVIGARRPGDRILLRVVRDGRPLEMAITLGRR